MFRPNGLTHRHRTLLPLLLAVLLVACGGGAPATGTVPPAAPTTASTATGTTAPAATAARAAASATSGRAATVSPTAPPAGGATPQRGGTVVVAVNADPGAMNPAITTAGGTHNVTDQIFNGLVGLDDNLNPVPELAASWEVGEGGKVYTFKLVPNVKWHDGVPFTSADVKFTFEQALLKFHARTKAALEAVLTGIETPDDGTVIFRFKQPYGSFLQRLDVVEAPIIAKHIYEGKEVDKDPANLKPIGTGPFRFVEYVKGDHVTLERNPDYFRPDRPYFDKAIYRIIPNATTATQALEQGEVDYLGSVQGSDLERLRANKGLTLVQGFGGSGGSICQDVLIPNLTKAPFDKPEVRRAFYQAIDRQFLLDRVYFGQGGLSTGPISRQMAWAYTDKVRAYPFDLAAANRALDAAGLPRGADGNRFTITSRTPRPSPSSARRCATSSRGRASRSSWRRWRSTPRTTRSSSRRTSISASPRTATARTRRSASAASTSPATSGRSSSRTGPATATRRSTGSSMRRRPRPTGTRAPGSTRRCSRSSPKICPTSG